MTSFFEKLRKGMGIELTEEEKLEEEPKEEKKETNEEFEKPIKEKLKKEIQIKEAEKKPKSKIKKTTLKTEFIEPQTEEKQKEETPTTIPSLYKSIEIKQISEEKEKWFEGPVGQLTVDVYQTESDLVIQSAIAGVKAEDLDISIEEEILTIKGIRKKPFEKEEKNYFYQECYWGPFSREIILPVEVDPGRATAEMKEGILTIRIPKIDKEKKRKIIVRGN